MVSYLLCPIRLWIQRNMGVLNFRILRSGHRERNPILRGSAYVQWPPLWKAGPFRNFKANGSRFWKNIMHWRKYRTQPGGWERKIKSHVVEKLCLSTLRCLLSDVRFSAPGRWVTKKGSQAHLGGSRNAKTYSITWPKELGVYVAWRQQRRKRQSCYQPMMLCEIMNQLQLSIMVTWKQTTSSMKGKIQLGQ